MKYACAIGIAVGLAPSAFAQEPPAAAPAAPSVASGWTGPVNFSPIAVVDLVSRACRPAVTGEGGDIVAHAATLGLGASQPASDDLSRALPPGAVTWRVPASDGVVYLYGYGEAPLSCGAAAVRPMPQAGFDKVVEQLTSAASGFVQESTQTLEGNIHWARYRSPKGEFVDVMEYPPNGDQPGVLRADYLPG